MTFTFLLEQTVIDSKQTMLHLRLDEVETRGDVVLVVDFLVNTSEKVEKAISTLFRQKSYIVAQLSRQLHAPGNDAGNDQEEAKRSL